MIHTSIADGAFIPTQSLPFQKVTINTTETGYTTTYYDLIWPSSLEEQASGLDKPSVTG
jgi:hypothetical protein